MQKYPYKATQRAVWMRGVYRLTGGILNAESGPGERLQVKMKSYPKEKVDVCRLPFELCSSQSCVPL